MKRDALGKIVMIWVCFISVETTFVAGEKAAEIRLSHESFNSFETHTYQTSPEKSTALSDQSLACIESKSR